MDEAVKIEGLGLSLFYGERHHGSPMAALSHMANALFDFVQCVVSVKICKHESLYAGPPLTPD